MPKHSIIVGGTKGVGREVAELFATAGQSVTVLGRNAVTTPGSQIESIAGNVEDVDSLFGAIIRRIEKRGKLSSLVFLQRYRGNGDSWTGELAVSMTATKVLIEGLVSHFDGEGDRSICIVTSNASSFVARNQTLGYHTSKAALNQMARFFAVKFGAQESSQRRLSVHIREGRVDRVLLVTTSYRLSTRESPHWAWGPRRKSRRPSRSYAVRMPRLSRVRS